MEKKRVLVGMSGGVDSSVAAALLLDSGFEVIGVTMKTYDYAEVGGNIANETSCCGIGALNDARSVAAKLGIPHYVLDFREAFKKKVIENFVSEYMEGRTPNPCVICNTDIKWGEFLKKAEALGADFIATGHYARVAYDANVKRYVLSKGQYGHKDQSYALWGLSQKALSKTMFPLGELTKPEVRKLAGKFKLRTADKEESYEICFVPDNNYRRFLTENFSNIENSVSKGDIVSGDEIVGKHDGYPFYTIGQRKGIGAYGQKMYVTEIDNRDNRVTIGTDKDLHHQSLIATDLNWVSISPPNTALKIKAKIRYKDEESPATLFPIESGSVKITFDSPKRAITPGQSVVFYEDERLLGGGIIEKTID